MNKAITIFSAAAALALASCSANEGDSSQQPGMSQPGPGGVQQGGMQQGGMQVVQPVGDPTQGGFFNAQMTTPRDQCATAQFKSDLVPANLLFIVDRSGSMNCNLDTPTSDCEANPVAQNPAAPTKWSVLGAGLAGAFDQLVTVQNTAVGLTFFSNDNTCGVDSMPNVGVNLIHNSQPHADALRNALIGVEPRGGTPIVGATITAYQHLHQEAQAPGNRFVVIVTDGRDSCLEGDRYGVGGNPLQRLFQEEIPKALSVNIRTFVIGAPGSEGARSFLSQLAHAGGTASSDSCSHDDPDPTVGDCHFDMTTTTDFAGDLSAALQSITGETALSCELEIPQSEDGQTDTGRVNVDLVRGWEDENPDTDVVEPLFKEDDSVPCDENADGWKYNEDQTKIMLCGTLCDTAKTDPSVRIDVVLGCDTRIK